MSEKGEANLKNADDKNDAAIKQQAKLELAASPTEAPSRETSNKEKGYDSAAKTPNEKDVDLVSSGDNKHALAYASNRTAMTMRDVEIADDGNAKKAPPFRSPGAVHISGPGGSPRDATGIPPDLEHGETQTVLLQAELVEDKPIKEDHHEDHRTLASAIAVQKIESTCACGGNCIDKSFSVLCCCFPKLREKSRTFKLLAIIILGLFLVGVVAAIAVVASPPKKVKTRAALLVVDVQDCFLEADVTSTREAGTLAVKNTSTLIPIINDLREQRDCLFDVVVRSQDFHPSQHISFASTHGLPAFAHESVENGGMGKGGLPITCTDLGSSSTCCPTFWINPSSQNCDDVLCPVRENMTESAFEHVMASEACTFCPTNGNRCFQTKQAMWPDHCIQNQEAGFPPTLDNRPTDIVLPKGDNDYVDGYSPFSDNSRQIQTALDDILKRNNIDSVYIIGIATDYGVAFAASHAKRLDYQTTVVLDATRAIGAETSARAVTTMKQEGIIVVESHEDLLAMECPK